MFNSYFTFNLTVCPPPGPLFQMADQPFNLSGLSGTFPLLGHPAFGLFAAAAGSGRSEFGGLGTLGVSAALGAHPQLGAFPGETRTRI